MKVLITGASSGIGLEIAKIFAKNNHDLVLVSKDRKRLEASARSIKEINGGISIKTAALDLSQDDSAKKLYIMQKGRIDALVNNAGFGLFGEFKDTDIDTELQMLHLNIIALTELTKYFAKDMIKRKSGRILNVASTAAFFPGPLMSVYYASKAYVLSFSVALENELRGTGVSLTVLCPGPTTSGFQEKARLRSSGMAKSKMMTSRQVAEIAYDAMMKNRLIVIPGLKNKFQAFASHLFPRKTLADMVRDYQG